MSEPDDRPVLTVLTGPAGVGRTHALSVVRQQAESAGRLVLEIRLAPADRDEPWYLVGRILAGLAPVPARLAAGRAQTVTGRPSPATLARTLGDQSRLTIIVDDVQWADEQSASVLLGALHELAGSPVRCFATMGTRRPPSPDVIAAFARLRATVSPVRPMSSVDVDELVRRELNAAPHESLAGPLRRLGRGRPAALLATLEGYRRSGALRVVDRRAYLADPEVVPAIPPDHDLMAPVRRLAPGTRSAARALAVLQPLGPAAPALIDADVELEELRRVGIARSDRRGWRIEVPAVAVALRAELGPYERARLAAIAVEAIRSGRAGCDDPGFLPAQVAAAGALVDAEAARAMLRDREDADAAGRRVTVAARARVSSALIAGDLAGARRELSDAGLVAAGLPAAERCLYDWRAGRWDAALDAAQYAIACELLADRLELRAAVHRVAAEVLLARGWPARARTVLEAGRTGDPPHSHLLDDLEAEIDWLLGEAGEPAGADDVQRARGLGQPYLLARTIERAVRRRTAEPDRLVEAYDLLGALGAVLHRSRVRQEMRDHGLTVPGRSQTLAEAERLLATLVAEGLPNKQLAAATQSSEKSVEGRLSRLFARTGYRSRVELAAAVLVGDLEAG